MIRLKTVFATLFALAATMALPASGAAQAPPDPSRSIDDYVLFGIEKISFKGGGSGAGEGEITGNVGVNNFSGQLNLGSISHDAKLLGTSYAASNNTNLDGSGTTMYDLYSNNVTGNFTPATAFRNSGTELTLNPDPDDAGANHIIATSKLPPMPACAPGTTDFTVNTNGSGSPTPGKYDLIEVKDGGTLTLGVGLYDITELRVGKDATINTVTGTELRIKDQLRMNDKSKFVGSDLTKVFICGEDGDSNDQDMNLGQNNEFHGQVYAPTTDIGSGQPVSLFGRFWARLIEFDFDSTVTYSNPALSTTASGTVTLGGKIHDTAHLSGAINPTGTITFDLYGPDDGDCSGAPVFTTDTSVNGNGDYDSADFTPTAVGTYRWIASYSGDANNQPLSNACNAEGEAVVVTGPPCVPKPGENANCQPNPPVTPSCIPKAGQDKNCKTISSTDSASVTGLKGGCSTTSNVRVSGSNIKRVTYKIDGKTVKTVKKGPFTYKLKTKDYKVGVHKLKVTTTFKSGKTTTKTLTFQHCRNKQPSFTG